MKLQKLLSLTIFNITNTMYKLILSLVLVIFIQTFYARIFSQNEKKFNEELATKLGADDYGMKTYVIAFLKKGPNRSKDSITRVNLQKAHLKNISRMANNGDLILAGPFLDDSEVKGIYIFNVQTVEEAKKLTETDPLIESGGLIMELHPWYGSAAIQEIGKIHKTIQRKDF